MIQQINKLLTKFLEPTKEEIAFRARMKLLKSTLKALAKDIKFQKSIRKLSHKQHALFTGHHNLSNKFRHLHVAYCLLRGRTLEQVDSGIGLDMKYVQWIQAIIKDENKAKLYVCIKDSLSDAQKAVQGAHAVAQFMKEHPKSLWTNGTLVFLKDTYPLWQPDYSGLGEATRWREPDMKNEVTACASFGPTCEEYFKGYKLV